VEDFGFGKAEVRFIAKYKPAVLLNQDNTEMGLHALKTYFVDTHGFSMELVRTLVVKFPVILSKDIAHIESVFSLLQSKASIDREEAMKLIFECPKLLSVNLEANMDEVFFLFDLYFKISQESVVDEIFKKFPYLFCCDTTKMQSFLGHFRKYRFSNPQILALAAQSGGLLACKPSNFVGMFDYLKINYAIKASEVV